MPSLEGTLTPAPAARTDDLRTGTDDCTDDLDLGFTLQNQGCGRVDDLLPLEGYS